MMKTESVLHALMYLFQYHMDQNGELNLNPDQLINQLEDAGFKRVIIHQALTWIANLADYQQHQIDEPELLSIRIYSDYECSIIDAECRGFIYTLEQQKILNPITREILIDQVCQLEAEGVDIPLIKWVALLVLFSQPSESDALNNMEFLVLHSDSVEDETH